MLKEGGVKLGDCLLQLLGLGHVVVLERLVDLEIQLGGKVEGRPDGGVDAEGVVPQVGLLVRIELGERNLATLLNVY